MPSFNVPNEARHRDQRVRAEFWRDHFSIPESCVVSYPPLQSSRPDLVGRFRMKHERSASQARERGAAVVAEVAFSVVLL